jgi:putative ABC transport system permease protein
VLRVARNLRLSIRALSVHRVRNSLAVGAAAIGIAGIVVLTAIGDGARTQVLERIERLGRNTLVVTPTRVEPGAGRRRQGSDLVVTLRPADAAAIVRASPAVRRAAPVYNREMPARYRRIETPATIIATTPDWLVIRKFQLGGGRSFTMAENTERARVAILGAEIRASLFADTIDPMGKIIRVGPVPFLVIGWLNPVGASLVGTGTEDDRIIIPLDTGLDRLFNRDEVRMLLLETVSADMSAAAEDVASILRARHRRGSDAVDDFIIQDPVLLLATELAARTAFQRLMSGLAVLSVFVGGAGILSIMLLAVRERRMEIGLRTALGARRRDIAFQFLAESLLIAATGGVIGISIGLIGRTVAARFTAFPLGELTSSLAWAAGSILILGVTAGVIPALEAARLDPVAALESR